MNFIKGVGCELFAHLTVRQPDFALWSVQTTLKRIPKVYLTVLNHICSSLI